MPTLLAVNRVLSSSSIFMPGLYLSNSVAYILCALTYCRNCSACSGVVSVEEDMALRIRDCSGERVDRVLEGSSRRKER